MSSRFWSFVANLIPGQTARSEQVNAKFLEVDEAFEGVAAEMNRAVRFTYGNPTEAELLLAFDTQQRAGKAIGFDPTGAVTLLNPGFVWRGDWAPGTLYTANDVIRAPVNESYSIYVCLTTHTSPTTFSSGSWSIMIDLTEARRSLVLHTLVVGPQGSFQLEPGQDVMVDVTGGAVTLTLPANPSISDQPINVMHVGGNVQDNQITIAGNGKRIMGLLENMVVDTTNASFGLAFCNDTLGWRIRGV